MLVVGVANLEEPFSYLSILSEMQNHRPIDDYLDLNCVDLKPEIPNTEVDKLSYCERGYFYDFYPKSSFIKEPDFYVTGSGKCVSGYRYKAKPHIVKYLTKVIRNPEKTFWNTDIVDFAENEAKKDEQRRKKYDIISNHYVSMYLNYDEDIKTAVNLVKMLNPGGILLTHDDGVFPEIMKCYVNTKKNKVLEKVGPGIYKKVGEIKKEKV